MLDNKELPSYYDSYQEMLLDDFYKQYAIHEDALYSVNIKEIDPDDNIFIANIKADGSFDFEVKYYNGGYSFNEAIDYVLNNVK